jgi:hypothetical protein
MRCRLTVRGPQGCFPLFAEPLDFLLEPFNLPLLSFDLFLGPVQLLGGNEGNRIWLPSALPLVPTGSHPLYGHRSEGFCSAKSSAGPISTADQDGKQIRSLLRVFWFSVK